MADCATCIVRNRAICASLNPAELAALGRMGRKQKVRAGQTLLWEGDGAPVVANVLEGVLKLVVSTADGREQIVGVVFPSDFIGRPFGKESPYSVTAMTDAEVCIFNRNNFDEFAGSHPDLQQKLLRRTLDELDRARHWMMLLGRKSASEKVASFLLEMSERLEGQGCGVGLNRGAFELPFGRQQIADILGLTIETTSRQLTKMRADGVLDLPSRREIVIHDRAAMEDMAG
ncbi:Crp/Fnr family transcriptional regulator [Sphingopyxis alaskensis]|uniref:Transcriptional regulator, Crp/Fnr family n=1 Tax=Sphingopyxis alaskensis (strain DSM 13593 / LMG 18877 / RB2256) TaxID=317655 RepID=Q1GSI1_SPHAL|nr:Crp/Fnr family transcriptional regulator [Sphingopyxis alaskensis]ABF53391.1 transcriptional regulator, Crp/Fnr family [Sphingopyxis alaskensis RB2256]MCM3419832.1 Crp/Fnr family transcriptional regulator [Sphingopyxis alaskensis]